MRTRALIAGVLLWAALASPGRADVVTLQNGDRISGSVQTWKDGVLTFKTGAGLLKIPTKKVVSLHMESPLLVTLEGKAPVTHAVVTDPKGGFLMAGRRTGIASIRSILAPPKTLDELDLWSGQAGLSVSLTDGNSHDLNVRGTVKLVRDQTAEGQLLRTRLTMGLKYNRGRSNGEDTTNAGWGGGKLDILIVDGLGVYMDGAVSFDDLADLARKTEAGIGATWTDSVEDISLKYGLNAGFSYITMVYDPSDETIPAYSETAPYLKLAVDAVYSLPEDFEIGLKAAVFPNLDENDRFLANLEAWVIRKVSAGWYLKLCISYRYNSHPALGKVRGDTTYFLSVVLKF
jgi:hypothetical protein